MKKLLIKSISAFISWILLMALSAASVSAAGNSIMNVSATIVSKSNCTFKTPVVSLPFPNLDPLSPVNVTATATATFNCKGSAPTVVYLISHDSGLYSTGPGVTRMRHLTDTTAYIPYTLALSPDTGSFPREAPPLTHSVTVTGTLLGANYRTAVAGDYTDTVTLTINP